MKVFKEVLDWTAHILGAVVIACVIAIFLAQPSYVEGSSMEPTLQDDDRIVINKVAHTFKKPNYDYGDIVIIDSRVDRERTQKDDIMDSLRYNMISQMLFNVEQNHIYWVKRVIGKAGDEIEYRNHQLFRNSADVEELYIKEGMDYFPEGKVVVPQGCIFVMGDNRNHSSDSRHIGSVPLDHVIGKLLVKF